MRAIVLAGGGARGAYEMGAWRALRELERSGWVQRQARYRHNGSRSSNLYTILR